MKEVFSNKALFFIFYKADSKDLFYQFSLLNYSILEVQCPDLEIQISALLYLCT